MKFIFRWAFRLFLVFVVLLVAAVLLMNTIIKSVLENRIREQSGRDVKIGNLDLSLLNSRLTIENFKLYNTAELGGGPFLELPELHIELDREALSRRELHFKLIRLHLAELNIVQSQSGRGGIAQFPQLNPQALTNQVIHTRPRQGDQLQFAGIDTLNLTLGRIKQIDLRQPANSREYPLASPTASSPTFATNAISRSNYCPCSSRPPARCYTKSTAERCRPCRPTPDRTCLRPFPERRRANSPTAPRRPGNQPAKSHHQTQHDRKGRW